MEIGVLKDKVKKSDEENLVLKMNYESVGKDMEREKEEGMNSKHSYQMEIQAVRNENSEKIKRQKEKYVKKLEKIQTDFEKIFNNKIEEIKVDAEANLNTAKLNE